MCSPLNYSENRVTLIIALSFNDIFGVECLFSVYKTRLRSADHVLLTKQAAAHLLLWLEGEELFVTSVTR